VAITRVNRVPAFIGSCFLFVLLAAPGVAWAQRDYDYQQESKQRDVYSASARLQIQPRDAEVFVDGQFVGRVDDFDGIFQRLRLTPGNHMIAIWRDGYRTEFHNVYFAKDSTRSLAGQMERLAPGMASGPRPGRGRGNAYGRPDWAGNPNNPNQRDPYGRDPYGRDPYQQDRFGTVALNIPVTDARIFVDGTRRNVQRRQGTRFELDLAPGRHRIEVRRSGYQTFSRDVVVRPGTEISVNVPLRRTN
jgi:hypothetical protein